MSPEELRRAILFEDATEISRANGVGKKTAERIILELKEKIGKLSGGAGDSGIPAELSGGGVSGGAGADGSADNRVEAIEFHVQKDAPVIGVPLMDLQLKSDLLIACIHRNGKIIFPRGKNMIKPGDTVIVVTTHAGLGDISDILAER